jgi:hypothetical protein
MIKFNQNRIRKLFIPVAFFFFTLVAYSVYSMEGQVQLTPPGIRPLKNPALVIPTDYRYSNKSIKLPAYRDNSGNPADGWSRKYVDIRRFVSNQSAWIYFRISDLTQSISIKTEALGRSLRFWPIGTTLVIESYGGNALDNKSGNLIEVAVMSKLSEDSDALAKVFYPVKWSYARFNADGRPSITSARVRECHQCHSIAFHFSGDSVFTSFP